MWIMMLARGCLTIWFASIFATHWLFWSQRFLICSPNPWKVFDSNLKWTSKLILWLILWSGLTWWCCCHPSGEWSTGGAASARARALSEACCVWWTDTGGCLKKHISTWIEISECNLEKYLFVNFWFHLSFVLLCFARKFVLWHVMYVTAKWNETHHDTWHIPTNDFNIFHKCVKPGHNNNELCQDSPCCAPVLHYPYCKL